MCVCVRARVSVRVCVCVCACTCVWGSITKRGGGATGAFWPGPQPERGPGRPHEGPPEYLFKRSMYSNRAVRSRYSNRAVTVFFRGAV